MKKRLINNIKNDTYCRIGVSRIHGVGVMAVKDISKNTFIFKVCKRNCDNIIEISKKEVENITPGVKQMMDDYLDKVNGKYQVPESGLNNLNISWYLNHSDTPNVDITEPARDGFVLFKTNKDIHKGEELFIDYSQ